MMFDQQEVRRLYELGVRSFHCFLMEGCDPHKVVDEGRALKNQLLHLKLFIRTPAWVNILQSGPDYEKSVLHLHAEVAIVSAMGADGYIISSLQKCEPDYPRETMIANAVKALKTLDGFTPILLENSPGEKEASPASISLISSICDEVKRHNVKSCLNLRNAWTQGEYLLAPLFYSKSPAAMEMSLNGLGSMMERDIGAVIVGPLPEGHGFGSKTWIGAPPRSLLEGTGADPASMLVVRRIAQVAGGHRYTTAVLTSHGNADFMISDAKTLASWGVP